MFGGSLEKTVQPHLHASERLLATVLAQAKGANASMLAHAVGGAATAAHVDQQVFAARQEAEAAADDAGVKLAYSLIVALTTERLLLFKSGGAFKPKAKEVLADVDIADVDAITVSPGKLTKALTLTLKGRDIAIETARAQPAESLAEALDAARARR
jgi:hypothetical protein